MDMYMQVKMPLACFFILLYTFLLYCLKKRLHTMTSRIYEAMVCMSIVHVLSAVITEYTVNNRDKVSYLFNHIWHIVFLVSVTFVCALLYLYLILYVERGTGKAKPRDKRVLFAVSSVSLLGELFLPITYEQTPYGAYSLGPKAYALYITVVYVMVMMLVTIIRYHKVLDWDKCYVRLCSVLIFVISAGIQICMPHVLLTGLGVSLIVLGLAINAEDVHMYFSGDTGLYNEKGCREILQEAVLCGRPFRVGMYAFLGRDDAIREAMKGLRDALPEGKSRVICGTLADNLLVVIPMQVRGKTVELPELPVPDASEDLTFTSEVLSFSGQDAVTEIINAAKDFKNRFEEDSLQRDELTGLLRRTAFIRQMEYMMKMGQSFAFLMTDLDNFKQVNDRFGHGAGDELLRKIAAALQGEVRTSDVVCRMGGDEFGILLSGLTTREAVSAVADRFLAAVSGICLPDGDTAVTLSIGARISRPTDRDRSFQAVYAKADAALYRAKYLGKNRITFAE